MCRSLLVGLAKRSALGAIFLAAAMGCAEEAVTVRQEGAALVVQGKTYVARFSRQNGALLAVTDRSTGRQVCLGTDHDSLWAAELRRGEWVLASEFAPERGFSYRTAGPGGVLSLEYVGDSLDVTVNVSAEPDGFTLVSHMTPKAADLLTVDLPCRLRFTQDGLERFHFPHDLGVALKRPFLAAGESLGGTYPPLFSDFVLLESSSGTLGVYRANAEATFVPASLWVGPCEGRPGEAVYDHRFNTYVRRGQTWRAPGVHISVGRSLKDALADYGARMGFRRTLADKMPPEVLAKLRDSVLLKYSGGTFDQQAASLGKFPSPCLLHLPDYMRGGFDKQYPDLLPPREELGTPEQFRALFDRAHDLGMLVMPYLNPTWWCDDPPSPSLEQYGDVALARDIDGNLYPEQYAANRGYSLTFAHPIAQQLRRRNVKAFTEEYPSDILFQDQIGARGWKYDFNEACPTPYAYTQGLLDIAREDAEAAPLSTENGFDRLLNDESQFCGLTWSLVETPSDPDWVRKYGERWSPDQWELSPIGLYLGHHLLAFTHHDLGQMIADLPTLTWSLAIGYQMIYFAGPGLDADGEQIHWLRWLDAVQKTIAARYMGARVLDFRYLARDVTRTEFEDLVIIANHGAQPYALDTGWLVAPWGFHVESTRGEPLVAGVYDRLDAPQARPRHFIRRQRGGRAEAWSLTAEPWSARPRFQDRTLRLDFVPDAPPDDRRPVPDALRGTAPADRADPPGIIGLIDIEGWPDRYGFTDVRASGWLNHLSESVTLRRLGLKVERLTSILQVHDASGDPGLYFAIINPYGEYFPVLRSDVWTATVEAVREYVAAGGIWWESGGYPFFYGVYGDPNRDWWFTTVGGLGLRAATGDGCQDLSVDLPAGPLTLTPLGRDWLGDGVLPLLQGDAAVGNRPPARDLWSVCLLRSDHGPFLTGYQPTGYGWLFVTGGRFAGDRAPAVATLALAHLYQTPPMLLPRPDMPRLVAAAGTPM